jgi:hypothetical protein
MQALHQNDKLHGAKLEVSVSDAITEAYKRLHVTSGGAPILKGSITYGQDSKGIDPNVGNYAVLTSESFEGLKIIRCMTANATFGYCAVIDHVSVLFELSAHFQLASTTGFSPESMSEDWESLAPRFTLRYQNQNQDVARCHLSYRDISSDPSIGPTIEKMAVHESHRGNNYLPILWFWVRCYIEENFLLECMNSNVGTGHVMIKASHLKDIVVEVKQDDHRNVTDMDFFYNFAGFSVRELHGPVSAGKTCRLKDGEVVLYIPLLPRRDLQERKTYPGPEAIVWPNVKGQRGCRWCGITGMEHLRCSRCKRAHYCSKHCQKQDWNRFHKMLCQAP